MIFITGALRGVCYGLVFVSPFWFSVLALVLVLW